MPSPIVRSARFAAIAAVLTGLLVATGPAAESAGGFCAADPSVRTFRWAGGAGTREWVDGANWNRGVAPGFDGTDVGVRVCLAAGDDVVLVHNDNATHGEAIVDVLDMQAGSHLAIRPSGRLFLEGDPAGHTSVVRRTPARAGVLTLSGTLGGIGTLRVDGRLDWTKTRAGTTMTTRHCQVFAPPCPAGEEPATPGHTRVAGQGVLTVAGGGVNLVDDRVITSVGRFVIRAGSYVAADNGTRIEVGAGASSVMELVDDASIYQGFADDPERALVRLAGTLVKTGGGTATIDADVQVDPTASSSVRGGWLSIGGDRTPGARVRPGASYGVGRCDGANSNCLVPVASIDDPGTLSVGLPTIAGAPTADVLVEEVPLQQVAKDLVPPVDIHVSGERSTAVKPMRFRFRLDQTAVADDPTPESLVILRKPAGAPAAPVVDCRQDGTPPTGRRACVASRTTLSDGDVRLVVNSQVNSRWKIR